MKSTKEIAIDFLNNGKFKESISLLSLLIETTANDSSFFFYRSKAYTALNNIDKAIQDLNRAIEINSQDHRYFKSRGLINSNLGKFQEAIDDFSRCLILKPDDINCLWVRSVSFAHIGELDNSLADAVKLCLLDPQKHKYFGHRAYCLLQLGEFKDAIEVYKKAINLLNNRVEYYNDIGFAKVNLYFEEGDQELLNSAIEDFDKAIKIDILFSDSYYRRGYSKYLLAVFLINNDLAFDFIPQSDPTDPENIHKFGMHIVDNTTPLINDALRDLYKSIKLYKPEQKAYAYYRIAQCFDIKSKKGRALKYIEEALLLQPDNTTFSQFKNKLFNKSNQNIANDDFPECEICGDFNEISDPGGSYWWCLNCEHSIDQEGNCVSEDCETCEKDNSNLSS